MADEDQLQRLKQDVRAWNAWRQEYPEIKIDLSEADLLGANLSEANLREADLRKANLKLALLMESDLSGANLSGTDLCGAPLSEANLSGANLSGADLRQANLIETNLDGATLTDASLWETQRAGWSIQNILCEAVYWDRDRQERTHYSPGEFERLYADHTKIVLHYEGGLKPIEVATLPALIQRIEATHPGCVLRLQSIQEAPGGATVTLVVDEGGRNPEELEALKTDIKSFQIALRRERGIRQELQVELSIVYNKILPRLTGQTNIIYGDLKMGDTYIAGQVGAQGPHAHAHDIHFNQLWSQAGQSLDLAALGTQLTTLRQHLRQEAVEPEHDMAIGAVANAEVAAKEGNGPKTLEFLSKAGQWTLDNATKIGVGVATAALKTALGL